MKRVYLSLGSNLGDRRANITKALEQLNKGGIEVRQVSSYYRTEPVGYTAQSWFVNCAAEVATDLMPLQLVRRCQAIERGLGRKPGVRNGPRPIDIDILLYGNAVVSSAEITIPHPRMAERRFVLQPLSEIAPSAEHPLTRQSVHEMLASAPPAAVKLADQLPVVSYQSSVR
jgi:2-amino-4-hydroxy-6-hydroxymethyldihydropteridine diphosphokinase